MAWQNQTTLPEPFVLRTLNNTCAGEGESGPGGEDYAFLAGQFRLPDGRTALLLQNQDWADSLWASVSWSVPLERVVEVDPSSGEELALMDDSPALVGLQVIRAIGAEGLNRRGAAGSCRPFLGPGFRLGACRNRLVETVKTRKK